MYLALAWGISHAVQDFIDTGDPMALIPYYHAYKYGDVQTTAVGLLFGIGSLATVYPEGTLGFALKHVPKAALYQYPGAIATAAGVAGVIGVGSYMTYRIDTASRQSGYKGGFGQQVLQFMANPTLHSLNPLVSPVGSIGDTA